MLNPVLTAQAVQIRIAIANADREYIDKIDKQFGLKRLTRVLVHYNMITPTERKLAISLRPYINNPSLRVHSYRG